MVVSIDKAVYLDGYKIKFDFSIGLSRTVDFEGFLNVAKNPMTKKILDKVRFRSFKIEYGDIIWNE